MVCVKKIIYFTVGKKKLQKVTLTISPKGIVVEDFITSEKMFEVSIYRFVSI